mgnify:CR=1 FL=1
MSQMYTNKLTNSIILGDCVQVMNSQIDAGSVDLIITSPPYNAQKSYEKDRQTEQEFWRFTEDWIEATWHVLKEGGAMFINTGYWSGSRKDRFFIPAKMIEIAENVGYKFTSWINWVKGSATNPVTSGSGWGDVYGVAPSFLNGTEPILYFRKGTGSHRDNKHDEWMKLIREPWVMPCSRNKEHDATFPIDLPRNCAKMCSVEGDTILDPFGGSGTTALACKELNRNYILIEKNLSYHALCVDRLWNEIE